MSMVFSNYTKKVDPSLLVYYSNDTIPQSPTTTTQEAASNLVRVPTILRWIGAIAFSVAATLFMFQGINSITFMARHWIFLGITAVLGGVGLYLGIGLQEKKGSRVLLGLAVALLPVLFSQLGAMIHAHLGVAPASMPDALRAIPENPVYVVLTVLATISLTFPLVVFGFSVLARPKAWVLAMTYFILNTCIIIPSRESALIGFLIAGMTATLLSVDKYVLSRHSLLRSKEGIVSRMMIAVPVLVIAIRTMFFQPGTIFTGSVTASIGAWLFFSLPSAIKNHARRSFLQITGAFLLSVAAPMIVHPIIIEHASRVYQSIFGYALPISAVLAAISFAAKDRISRSLRSVSAIITVITVSLAHLSDLTAAVSIGAIILGISYTLMGSVCKERIPFYIGILCGGTGMISGLWSAVTFSTNLVWIAPAVAGFTVLMAASVIEVNKLAIAKQLQRWRWVWMNDTTMVK